MASLNNCTFSGNLGADADRRGTPTGKTITELRLAVACGWGEHKSTMWIKCMCWEKLGDFAAELRKGEGIVVSGRLENRPWKDKEGNDRLSLEMTVSDFKRLGKFEKEDRGDGGFSTPPVKPPMNDVPPTDDSDLPF